MTRKASSSNIILPSNRPRPLPPRSHEQLALMTQPLPSGPPSAFVKPKARPLTQRGKNEIPTAKGSRHSQTHTLHHRNHPFETSDTQDPSQIHRGLDGLHPPLSERMIFATGAAPSELQTCAQSSFGTFPALITAAILQNCRTTVRASIAHLKFQKKGNIKAFSPHLAAGRLRIASLPAESRPLFPRNAQNRPDTEQCPTRTKALRLFRKHPSKADY